ncbi:MAG: ATP-binding protein, partial [Solirubrobacteraceae bacterium]
AQKFRRFSDLTIELDGSPKLVVLAGPNGVGKSSLFDALKLWHGLRGGSGWTAGDDYWIKGGQGKIDGTQVAIEFQEDTPPEGTDAFRKAIYIRTAYRNDPDFAIQQIQRLGSVLNDNNSAATAKRLIDNDVRVSDNYQRMVALTLEDVYGGQRDGEKVSAVRERYIGEIRGALQRLFPDLILNGPGDPLGGGTFYFGKGVEKNFLYKNLSGGEKAAFDLLLDMVIKKQAYDDTVYCIDEPDTHLNTRVQGVLLQELVNQVNDDSQLWIATHSIGMMRVAREMQRADPGSVAFIDFQGHDFDQAITLQPVRPDRKFWSATLDVALGDLADLIAPAHVVLCEGDPASRNPAKAEFDARCYRTIFGDAMADTEFLSVGSSLEVIDDHRGVGRAISTIVSGTKVVRVVDRDNRSTQEVEDARAAGIRVLSRRHLEAFLLDDEVLEALCKSLGKVSDAPAVLALKPPATAASVARGNDPDDIKSAAGDIFNGVRKILETPQLGNTTEAFLSDTMAPLLVPGMTVYEDLKKDLFE